MIPRSPDLVIFVQTETNKQMSITNCLPLAYARRVTNIVICMPEQGRGSKNNQVMVVNVANGCEFEKK